MIRKSLFTFFLIPYLLSLLTVPTFAQTSSSQSSSVIEKLKQIEALKEKIATKVAQIREKDKIALSGVIKKITQTSLLITTAKGNEVSISYSDDTLFYTRTGNERKEVAAKSLKENDFISVFGYKEAEGSTVSSKYIYVQVLPTHVIGKIADIDKTNFTITVKDKEGSKVIDIESSTKMALIALDKKKQKGGFSKFQIGDIIHVVGNRNKKDAEKISASSLITLSNPNQTLSPTLSVAASASARPKK